MVGEKVISFDILYTWELPGQRTKHSLTVCYGFSILQ